jgi:tetratricopeptide (TPR) repeat protein
LADAQTQLGTAASMFLGEAQATRVLNRLYTYAQATGVEIVNLQTATAAATDIYVQRSFQFEVVGPLQALLNFLGSMDEVNLRGFFVDNVILAAQDDVHQLTMSVSLYTSPYATQDAAPLPLDNLVDLPLDQVQSQLAEAWAAADWERAIQLLDRLLTVHPDHAAARVALYRAHVNNGYRLLAARDMETARQHFEQALAVLPEGSEARAELDQMARDGQVAYTVQDSLRQDLVQATGRGDWQRAIHLLRLIEAIDPAYGPVADELFTAYVNYGSWLAAQGSVQAAAAQYELAHLLLPDRPLPALPSAASVSAPDAATSAAQP